MFSPQKCFDAQIWNSAATSDTQIQILGSNLSVAPIYVHKYM